MQRANVVDRAQFAKPWMNGNAKRGAADGCGEMVARPLLAAVPEGRALALKARPCGTAAKS